MSRSYRINVVKPGPRPPYYKVAEHLWGPGCNIDSDGNSEEPEDDQWTELAIELRDGEGKRVDVDPVSMTPLILQVRSSSFQLAEAVAVFIVQQSGGELQYVA